MINEKAILDYIPHFYAFLRINALLSFLPFFGDNPIPLRFRSLLSLVLTVVILGSISEIQLPKEIFTVVGSAFLAISELFVGAVIGFVAKLCFDTVVVGATLVATQMGFGADRLFIPDFSGELDSFTAFHRMIVLLLFLSLNLHYGFVMALTKVFEIVPLFEVKFNSEVVSFIVTQTGEIFLVAIQLAAPILVAILLSTTALGILSRSVPQLNIFVISYAINFLLGMAVYVVTLAIFPDWLEIQADETLDAMYKVAHLFRTKN